VLGTPSLTSLAAPLRMRPRTVVAADPRRPRTAPDGTEALVVGGGIAGVSAAVVLAERGVSVTLIEAAPTLGGRLGAWPHTLPDGTDQVVEHGFHAFFRHYYTWRAILRRIDPELGFLRPVGGYPVLSRTWEPEDPRYRYAKGVDGNGPAVLGASGDLEGVTGGAGTAGPGRRGGRLRKRLVGALDVRRLHPAQAGDRRRRRRPRERWLAVGMRGHGTRRGRCGGGRGRGRSGAGRRRARGNGDEDQRRGQRRHGTAMATTSQHRASVADAPEPCSGQRGRASGQEERP